MAGKYLSRTIPAILSLIVAFGMMPTAWGIEVSDYPEVRTAHSETVDSVSGKSVDDFSENDGASSKDDSDSTANNARIGSGDSFCSAESGSSAIALSVQDESKLEGQSASVAYSAHVAYDGWHSEEKNGSMTGTTGESKPIEALAISVDAEYEGSVTYSVFERNHGWVSSGQDGAVAGTTGRGIPLEAMRVALTGELSDHYDVYYRTYCSNIGWLDWASNGADAGAINYGYSIEAFEIVLIEKGEQGPCEGGEASITPMISAKAHIANIGWSASVFDREVMGTVGRSLPMEAVTASLLNTEAESGIRYSVHVSNVGWMDWASDGEVAGTTGQSLGIEAIRFELTGDAARRYDVYYQVHVGELGWLDWACNGAAAGTIGNSNHVQAIRIVLVEKGAPAPGNTSVPFVEKALAEYSVHVQNVGWQERTSDGIVAGTVGQGLQIEAFEAQLSSKISGGIQYSIHVSDIGWQGPFADGSVAGTVGQSRRAEAISISLTGEASQYYDVYYRVHSETYGWLGWAMNGEYAGTTDCGYRMEAIQVCVVIKGGVGPAPVGNSYRNTPPVPASYLAMNQRISSISSSTGWAIAVDSANCLVGIYQGSKGNWKNVHMWSCGPGAPWTPTVKGIYSIGMRGYVFGSGYSCYYWTQFFGDYLFHSVLYYPGSNVIMDGTLGAQVSHGCVRLSIENARWIYDNIPSGTAVLSY